MFEKGEPVFFGKWICCRSNTSYFQEFDFTPVVQTDKKERLKDQVDILMNTLFWQILPACAFLQKVIKAKENVEVQPYKTKQFRIVFLWSLKRRMATEQIKISTFQKLKFVFPCGII